MRDDLVKPGTTYEQVGNRGEMLEIVQPEIMMEPITPKKEITENNDGQIIDQPEVTQKEEAAPVQPAEKTVPYDRFQEVIKEKNDYKARALKLEQDYVEALKSNRTITNQPAIEKTPEQIIDELRTDPKKFLDNHDRMLMEKIRKEELEPRDKVLKTMAETSSKQAEQYSLEKTMGEFRAKYDDFSSLENKISELVEKGELNHLKFYEKDGITLNKKAVEAAYRYAGGTGEASEETETRHNPPVRGKVPFVESPKGAAPRKGSSVDLKDMSADEMRKRLPRVRSD